MRLVAELDLEGDTRRAIGNRLHVRPLFDPFPESSREQGQRLKFGADEFLLQCDCLSYSSLCQDGLLNENSDVLTGHLVRRPSKALLTFFGSELFQSAVAGFALRFEGFRSLSARRVVEPYFGVFTPLPS